MDQSMNKVIPLVQQNLVTIVLTGIMSSMIYGIQYGMLNWLLWCIIGYFSADIAVAINHYHLDNFEGTSSGYIHHANIARYGYDQAERMEHNSELKKIDSEKHVECGTDKCEFEGTELVESCECRSCYPIYPYNRVSTDSTVELGKSTEVTTLPPTPPCCNPCSPCIPCNPCAPKSCQTIVVEWLYKFVLAVTPVVFNPLFSNMVAGYLVYESLNEISGSGLPDYYAHNRSKAPAVVKLAQDYKLMMSVDTHKHHHATPVMNYAYFSPLTNILLDKTYFWSMYKNYILLTTDKKYTPVPFNKNIHI